REWHEHVAPPRIRGINGNSAAVRIGQLKRLYRVHENVRRDGAHVKAAQVVFSAHIEALVRRRFSPAKTVDEAGLEAHTQRVLVVQRLPLCERKQRTVKSDVSAQAGNFRGDEQAPPPVRPDRTVDGAEPKRRGK